MFDDVLDWVKGIKSDVTRLESWYKFTAFAQAATVALLALLCFIISRKR